MNKSLPRVGNVNLKVFVKILNLQLHKQIKVNCTLALYIAFIDHLIKSYFLPVHKVPKRIFYLKTEAVLNVNKYLLNA